MPFIGAAITPHTPLLIPSIGKEHLGQIERTLRALLQIKAEVYALHPDAIVVIHPHGHTVESSFTAHVADHFDLRFAEFGDLLTSAQVRGEPVMAQLLKERAYVSHLPFTLSTVNELSYDVGVPLLTALPELSTTTVLPISPSTLDRQAHVFAGRLLADVLNHSPKRAFVVVSAELSHHATAAAPGGARVEGAQFDRAVQKNLSQRNVAGELLGFNEQFVELAKSCGYLPLLMLAGMIGRKKVRVKKLSYESPFGIGLLTASIQPL